MSTYGYKSRKIDIGFIIGRFQPFHNGHKFLVDAALRHAEKVVIMVGSSNASRSYKNPWLFDERREMIERSIDQDELYRVYIEPLPDVLVSSGSDDLWLSNVHTIIDTYLGRAEGQVSYGVVGFKKDVTSNYLDLFPEAHTFIIDEGFSILSSTHIRNSYFKEAPAFPDHLVHPSVIDFMVDFYSKPAFEDLLGEKQWMDNEAKLWAGAPFPPQFVTCDAVCTQMGHVLLVTRGEHPGRGLLALPGGFVDASKGDSFDNVLWELWEETQMEDDHGRIPRGKLNGFYTGNEKRFDNPNRSVRGYTLTTAFRFKFPNAKNLFKVVGGDDATKAAWYPISAIKNNPNLLFEDHYHIIMEMI